MFICDSFLVETKNVIECGFGQHQSILFHYRVRSTHQCIPIHVTLMTGNEMGINQLDLRSAGASDAVLPRSPLLGLSLKKICSGENM